MNAQDLFDAFGLDDDDDVQEHDDLNIVNASNPVEPEAVNDTALEVDQWTQRRAKELVDDRNESVLGKLLGDRTEAYHEAADFFSAAFEIEPTLKDGACKDRARQQFVGQLLQTPEYHSLHNRTNLDDNASQLAAASFAQQYLKMEEERQKQPGGENPKGPKDPNQQMQEQMQVVAAVGQALQDADQQVDGYENAKDAMGWGTGGGDDQTPLNPKQIRDIYNQIRGSKRLQDIVNKAGRYIRLAMALQKRKFTHGSDEVTGIECGNDPTKILPQELAMIAVGGELEDYAMMRFAERQMLQTEVRGVDYVAKGPIMVYVDESGSMSGNKEINAKALSLALARIARRQRRWICFAGFHGRPDELRVCVQNPGNWNDVEMLGWVASQRSGGTSFEFLTATRMEKLFRMTGAPRGKTDAIIITDGDCNLDTGTAASFRGWAEENKCKLYALGIQGSCASLKSVADEIYMMPTLDVDQAGVAAVLSI